jgi:hypothetical protein
LGQALFGAAILGLVASAWWLILAAYVDTNVR